MIIYNGQALEAVAPVKIEDVRVSPIARNPQARQRPVRFGADFVRMGGGTRTVTITLAMLTQNTQQRRREMESVACWAQSAQESKLILPDTPDRYLECFCTEFPDMSVWKWWESRMKMVFTCYDNPYWTDIAEQGVSCGTQFSVIGSAHDGPLMRIERTLSAAASNQAYSNGTETMTFSTIPAGNLVIDMNRQTAAVGNTSIMQYYTFGSAFLLPRAGLQTITGTGSVKWRERWE